MIGGPEDYLRPDSYPVVITSRPRNNGAAWCTAWALAYVALALIGTLANNWIVPWALVIASVWLAAAQVIRSLRRPW